MNHLQFYFVSAVNYSRRAILVELGFTNKKNEQVKSDGLFIPKSAVKSIDFKSHIIEIAYWFYKNNTRFHHYRVKYAPLPPIVELDDKYDFNDVKRFDPNHSCQDHYPTGEIEITFPDNFELNALIMKE